MSDFYKKKQAPPSDQREPALSLAIKQYRIVVYFGVLHHQVYYITFLEAC